MQLRSIALVALVLLLGAGATLALVRMGSDEGGSHATSPNSEATRPGLRTRRGVVRGAGWLDGRVIHPDHPASQYRLVAMLDPEAPDAEALMRSVRAMQEQARVEVVTIWAATTPERAAMEAWMAQHELEGHGLYGLERDVAQDFGGALPILRLFDKTGRIVARDRVGAMAALRGVRGGGV